MMNIALIFAGGTGQRMNTKSSPKQFLKLHGKPILIYTLETFDAHPDIDTIVVVCLREWIAFLEREIDRFGLTKIEVILPGGKTGFESIHNGLMHLEKRYDYRNVVLIHDGVRPLVSEETIASCVRSTLEYGSGIAVAPAVETIITGRDSAAESIIDRSSAFTARAPQSFFLGDICDAHAKAIEDGFTDAIDSVSLMVKYGYNPHLVLGNSDNIKITTPSDFYVFRAIVDAKENAQIFGI